MRIYQLTSMGRDLAKTPTKTMTAGWRVVYFLRKHGGRATDDQIKQFASIGDGEFAPTMNSLINQKVVAVIG